MHAHLNAIICIGDLYLWTSATTSPADCLWNIAASYRWAYQTIDISRGSGRRGNLCRNAWILRRAGRYNWSGPGSGGSPYRADPARRNNALISIRSTLLGGMLAFMLWKIIHTCPSSCHAFSTLNSLPFFKITTSAKVDIEDKTMTKTMAVIRYFVGIMLVTVCYFLIKVA